MASPSWFFSALAQSVAAIAGFIITLVAVVYQLNQNKRRNRTNELRESLVSFRQKYSDSLYQVMEILKEPFPDTVPCDIPEKERLESSNIKSIPDKSRNNSYSTNVVWIHCQHISNLLSGITVSGEPDQHQLLSEHEIKEIIQSTDEILDRITTNNSSVKSDIDSADNDFQDLSVNEPISGDIETNYTDLGVWFQRNFKDNDKKSNLEGNTLLSLQNYFEELERDINKIHQESKNTTISSSSKLTDIFPHVALLVFVGIFMPLASMISLPNNQILLSGIYLTFYELILLTLSILFLATTISSLRVWIEDL